MPYTPEQKEQFDLQCYGMSEAEVVEHLAPQAEFSGKEMLVMSMLSDVQHLIEYGQAEQARQLINRTKLVISDFPENDMDARLKQHRAARKANG